MKKLLTLLLCFCLSSCIFVPLIDSFKKAGLTEADRKVALAKNLKGFHDALHWASINEALAYVESDSLEKVSEYLQQTEEEKVVESKAKSIKFDSGAFEATVDMKTKAYKIPVYVVEERVEREIWEWSLTGEWQLKSIELLPKK